MAKKKRNIKKKIGLILLSLIIIILLMGFLSKLNFNSDPKIAIVHLDGPISITTPTTSFLKSSNGIEKILKDLNQIKKDSTIKGVIIQINSPGGTVVASQEIANAVKNIGKPSIALIREVGASGGYWVASAADEIVASEVSITGSIGVISSYLEFSDLFEKYGVSYERLVAGERKDLGVPYRKLSVNEKVVLQNKINLIHEYFIKEVAKNRKMDLEKVKNYANGEFYLGSEALKIGLIDKIGDREIALNLMKEKIGADKIQIVEYKKESGILNLFGSGAYAIGKGIGDSLSLNDESLVKV
ncbi:signal peptide peptidase SppA [Candidatus Woesearchaeota archaeon]|nr:signal peptide peptidase SppA [Candidatus Woesearchaeota archaeon]